MSQYNDNPDPAADLAPKQRYELERWARLNDMSLTEFLDSNEASRWKQMREQKAEQEARSRMGDAS
ncbi:MAG: hypothetical protein ACQKBV_04005 [Puniceicoccales bacterium]